MMGESMKDSMTFWIEIGSNSLIESTTIFHICDENLLSGKMHFSIYSPFMKIIRDFSNLVGGC